MYIHALHAYARRQNVFEPDAAHRLHTYYSVGFVAAAVSMPMGGCRANWSGGVSSVAVVVVDIPVAAEPVVL